MYRCNNCFNQFEQPFDECPLCGFRQGDPPKELYHLFAGTELYNRYIIGEVLGFGGFGITYKAWDMKLETIVAIKEYYPSGIVNRTPGTKELIIYASKRRKEFDCGKDRFLDEARNMAKFNSDPNIVNVFEFFEENNTAYIVMEFLDGITLSRFLHDNGGKVDVDTGIQIIDAVCNALGKIHSAGIIHRDVSPDNIFLCIGGAIKLIDFGAARFSQDEGKLMTIILKPGFAPPEQYDKINHQGPWTDVYALGATFYYIITGEKPLESTNRKIKDELPYPHEINADIPEYISNTIMKAMAIDLHLRFSDIKQFSDAIHRNKKVLPVAVEKKRRKRNRVLGITGTILIITAGVSVSIYKWDEEKKAETLPDSEIAIWYCKSGDDELDAAEQAAYEAIAEDFNSSFPNVKISISGFNKEEYAQKLSDKDKPNLYEYVETAPQTGSLSLKDVYDSEEIRQCSVLNEAKDYFGNYNYLPTGFNVPVVFSNTMLCDFSKDTVSSLEDMTSVCTSASGVMLDRDLFPDVFNCPVNFYSENAADNFYDEKTMFFGTNTSEYFNVRETLPAQYRLMPCSADKIPCVYDNVWCANDLDESENKAVIRFLEFMLSNNAQDELHVRNKSTSLPVNDAVLDVFVEVYDDFEGFFDNKDKYVFKK